MPFIAELNGEIVNSLTLPEEDLNELYEQPLICVCCNGGMHISHSPQPYNTPFFRHNPNGPECPTTGNGISEEHLALQALVYAAIKQHTPWEAYVEYPGDGWRGDVVAINPANDRLVSFEVQLANMGEGRMQERTRLHRDSGADPIIWLCGQDYRWADKVPSARLLLDDWDKRSTPTLQAKVLPLTKQRDGQTFSLRNVPMDEFVGKILLNEAVPHFESRVATNINNRQVIRLHNGIVFETPHQIHSRTNQKRIEEIETQKQHLSLKPKTAADSDMSSGLKKFIDNQASVVEAFQKTIPDITFTEGMDEMAFGMHAFHAGKLIVANPSRRKVSLKETPVLFDEATVVIFANQKDYEEIDRKFRGKINVQLLSYVRRFRRIQRLFEE